MSYAHGPFAWLTGSSHWLALGVLAALAPPAACADEPPSQPILRVETAMHTAVVRRLVVDPQRNRLITAGDDKTVRIWQLPQGRLARVLRFPIGAGYEGRIQALALSPDGRTLAAGGWTGWQWDRRGAVYLFDAESGDLVRRVADFPDIIGALAWSRDGRYLAVGLDADGGLRVLRTSDFTVVARDDEYRDKILGADFHADGRLAVSALDGQIRVYDPALRLVARKRTGPGAKPLTVRFAPNGERLAVSFHDVPAIAVLRAADLSLAYAPDTTALERHSNLIEVAWSDDGETLYSCGDYSGPGETPILRWRAAGRGPMERVPAARRRIADLQPLPGGGVAFAAEDPAIGALDAAGRRTFFRGPEIVDFGAGEPDLKVSRDAARVEWGARSPAAEPRRFSILARELLRGATPAAELAGPLADSAGFVVAGWRNGQSPSINGVSVALDDYEISHTYAVSPDHATLVLGTEWSLRAYDREARLKWRVDAPGAVRTIVVAPNGLTVVVALADGTLRWYRIEDGGEFLALFPHADGREWIAWTPEGYYISSVSGDNYIGWHLNRGKARGADFYHAVQFERILYRPDLVDEAFRRRGRPAEAPARRAIDRFNVAGLGAIAPPRVRVDPTGTPRAARDGRVNATIRFTAEQVGLPMLEHAVFVNGIPVTPGRARALSDTERRAFAREVELELAPGENRVRVEVATPSSLGYAETFLDVTATQSPAPAMGDLYLLAVGVNEFPGLANAGLAYAARDAVEFARLFERQAPAQFRRVIARTVSDFDGAAPVRERILEALDFAAEAGARDTVILFLASHGVSDAGGNYFLVPRDARAEDVAAVTHGRASDAPSLIRWTAIFDALRQSAGRRILVVDTCHARDVEGRLDLRSLGKRSAAAQFSLVLAAQGHEASQEYPPARHGLFTHALLEGLRGAADADGDGLVTLGEAFGFAVRQVERLRDRALGPQTPQLLTPEPLTRTILTRAAAAGRESSPR